MTSILTLLTALTLQSTPILPIQPAKPLQPPPAIIAPAVTEFDNPNHCTDSQWIASESPYYCINKEPLIRVRETQVVPVSNYYDSTNTYFAGQCVWAIKQWRPDIPNGWGNAYSWIYSAQSQGWATGYTPAVNAVGVAGNHVVLVTALNDDGSITIREMNYDYVPFHERYRSASATEFTYIY